MAVAEKSATSLLEVMDHLWFHQPILFSKPSLFSSPEIPKLPLPISDSSHSAPTNISQIHSPQEISPAASVFSCSQDETSSQETEYHIHDKERSNLDQERPTRLNHVSRKTRYRSSSPILAQKQKMGNLRHPSRLQKSMSCKSLGELELEEVKGFMDLGFVFKKENLSKKIMSLIPGLQRLDAYEDNNDEKDKIFDERNDDSISEDDEEEEEEEEEGSEKERIRPYLSEAWVIRRPDSPLLNLRIPRVANNSSADMKKQLKFWARTVALAAIQQES